MNHTLNREIILVVDDALDTLEVLQRNLNARGYKVYTASSAVDAIAILEKTQLDLVVTDYKMPRVSGLDLIRHVRENYPDIEVVMITGYATIEGAVTAVKTGADEYLAKPFTDQELFEAIRRSLDKLHIRRAGHELSKLAKAPPYGLIGEAKSFKVVYDIIDKAADTPATVLINGESGTGKELVARAVHYRSKRASGPFVPVNCGGIPEGLLESELFGHVKGAFTGATETRAGFFQTAQRGTIFLDEISELSISMQVKLLRVLQDKMVNMVGDSHPRHVDVRIVAATNKDLPGMVSKGLFREDLFFRLNVIVIEIPPLRKRSDDILLLANHFIEKFTEEYNKPALTFTDKALRALQSYDWPGNVRELENLMQRVVVMSDEPVIDVPSLPSPMRFSVGHSSGFTKSLIDMEVTYIQNVLNSVDGNKTKAAEILGINRKTLHRKLQEHETSKG